MMDKEELGYFGNIWVRKNHLTDAGDVVGGHAHHHDHVTLLTSGSVEVTVEGHPPKVFKAPTFIVIRKEYRHQFVALEDDTVWYCVFALRDLDGDIADMYDDDVDPLSAAATAPDAWEGVEIIRERKTASI